MATLTNVIAQALADKGVVVNQKNLDLFWKFIFQRHMIWYKRFKLEQPAPWTDDPILKEYKFTNVYRELDRGTLFLIDNILGKGTPMEDVFNIIIYRMFNRISTYQLVGYQNIYARSGTPDNPVWSWKHYECFDIWRCAMVKGQPLYTDAHMVCAYEHFPGKDKLERFEYIFKGVFKGLPALMNIIKKAKSLEVIHKALTKFPGIGPFLAYEIAVDISYAKWNNLSEDEWVNPGPGCQRGLKFIFEGLPTGDCDGMIRVLRFIQKREFKRLNLPFDSIAYLGRDLTLRNIEHCLCECFKYFKALNETGRPRNKFTAKAKPGSKTFNRLKG